MKLRVTRHVTFQCSKEKVWEYKPNDSQTIQNSFTLVLTIERRGKKNKRKEKMSKESRRKNHKLFLFFCPELVTFALKDRFNSVFLFFFFLIFNYYSIFLIILRCRAEKIFLIRKSFVLLVKELITIIFNNIRVFSKSIFSIIL